MLVIVRIEHEQEYEHEHEENRREPAGKWLRLPAADSSAGSRCHSEGRQDAGATFKALLLTASRQMRPPSRGRRSARLRSRDAPATVGGSMPREMCYRCFWPKPLCWCGAITPMPTRTRFVFLMHPKEWKQEKAATGRLTHLCLPNSVIVPGTEFDHQPDVQAVITDPANFCVVLYPGRDAVNVSDGAWPAGAAEGRRLVVFVLDATWSLGRKMLRLSPSLQRLPRVVFTPSSPSRYLIKQQPHPSCLSTLEAVHELLGALTRSGLDAYPLPNQLLDLFARMQDFQLRCAADPGRGGYRHGAYRPPAERKPFSGHSATRRAKIFQAPDV